MTPSEHNLLVAVARFLMAASLKLDRPEDSLRLQTEAGALRKALTAIERETPEPDITSSVPVVPKKETKA